MTRRPSSRPADAGFVLFEVLVAATLLATVGTVVLVITSDAAALTQDGLERSSALLNMESFALQRSFEPALDRLLEPVEHDGISYQFSMSNSVPRDVGVRLLTISARPERNPNQPPWTLTFAIPVEHATRQR